MLRAEPKVILKDEVLEVRNVDGRPHIARKPRHFHEWDPAVEPYDPDWPGDQFIHDYARCAVAPRRIND